MQNKDVRTSNRAHALIVCRAAPSMLVLIQGGGGLRQYVYAPPKKEPNDSHILPSTPWNGHGSTALYLVQSRDDVIITIPQASAYTKHLARDVIII